MHEPTDPIPYSTLAQGLETAAYGLRYHQGTEHSIRTAIHVCQSTIEQLTPPEPDDLHTTVTTVLDLIGQAQRASDPGEMVRLMREATATMDAHRAPEGPTETPHCAGVSYFRHPRVPMVPGPTGWSCPACPEQIDDGDLAEDRPEPDEAPLPSWDRLRQIAGWADEGVFLTDEEAPVLRAIANDYEAMAGRELARQKATTGPAWAPTTPDLTARLAKALRLAEERGRYIEALETVLCPDGVPQAVSRAMEDLRPVPEVVAPPKIVDLEQVLDELARHEASAVEWDGSVTEAARRLRAAVDLARSSRATS